MAHSTRQVYDGSAGRYHERFRGHEPYRSRVLELAERLPAGARVLDLGCGPGVNARLLADAGMQVTGYDLSPVMLEIARRECPAGEFHLADLRRLPPIEPGDALLASFCIVHFEDREAFAFLRALPALMRSGALLYLSFMEGRQPGWETPSFADQPLFYNYFERDRVLEVLSRCGLKPISTATHDYAEPDGSTTTDVFLLLARPGGEARPDAVEGHPGPGA